MPLIRRHRRRRRSMAVDLRSLERQTTNA